jgi:hypothetical protein
MSLLNMPTEYFLSTAPLRKNAVPLWSCSDYCWYSVDHWLYQYNYETRATKKVFRLPRKAEHLKGRLTDALARSAVRQLLRPAANIHHLVELPGGDLVVVFDRVYWYSPKIHGCFAEVLSSDAQPPLATPLRGGMAVHPHSQCAYYGEYNDDPAGVRVARVNVSARRVEVCWTFPRSVIRHIHAIHYDRFRNRLWICTGDRDHESSLYYSDDEFATVHRFAGGDQSWRAIAILFDETGMEWGMDAGKDAPSDAINLIYRYEFAQARRSVLATIGNPAYATCEFTDGTAVMQTSFEPGRQQDTTEEAALWFRGSDRQWRQGVGIPYSSKPRYGAGRYASILIAQGISPTGKLLMTPVNCRDWNFTLLMMNVRTTQIKQ